MAGVLMKYVREDYPVLTIPNVISDGDDFSDDQGCTNFLKLLTYHYPTLGVRGWGMKEKWLGWGDVVARKFHGSMNGLENEVGEKIGEGERDDFSDTIPNCYFLHTQTLPPYVIPYYEGHKGIPDGEGGNCFMMYCHVGRLGRREGGIVGGEIGWGWDELFWMDKDEVKVRIDEWIEGGREIWRNTPEGFRRECKDMEGKWIEGRVRKWNRVREKVRNSGRDGGGGNRLFFFRFFFLHTSNNTKTLQEERKRVKNEEEAFRVSRYLRDFYSKLGDTSRSDQAEELTEKYRGNYEMLFSKLKKKYGKEARSYEEVVTGKKGLGVWNFDKFKGTRTRGDSENTAGGKEEENEGEGRR